MYLLRRCFLAFLLLFAVPLPAASGDSDWLYRGSDIPRDPAWQLGTLQNGLRYAVRKNALPAGQVSIRIRINAGALNEEDPEQGWAHFVEHLVFRGTKSFNDREARYTWQQLGANFGSDTNASTGATQTVYQLDLPKNDRGSLDKTFAILAEMMDSARFEKAAVDGERQIVLQEKARRSQLSTRMDEMQRPIFYRGLKLEKRNIIGTDATLGGATAEGLKAFYERWYRPDHATVVVVGDADPAMLIELVTKYFSPWQPSGPAPAPPDYGKIAEPQSRVGALAYPGAPYQAQLVWLRPARNEPNTIAEERIDLTDRLAQRIINRRLEARARTGTSFLGSSIGAGNDRRFADMTTLSITARESHWQEGLNDTWAILADAVRAPPSANEIARELAPLRTGARASVDGESTVRSPQWAGQMVNAVDSEDVVTPAAAYLQIFDRLASDMTPARVHEAMKRLLTGSGPRMTLLTPTAVEGGIPAVGAALTAAQKVAAATRQADRMVSFDSLPRLGPPGKEVSRQKIEDMGVTIVRFANGSTLTFKQTEFEKGSVSVVLRFGNGIAGLPPDRVSLGGFSGVVRQSGFADLDLDGVERLLTGRRIGYGFGMGEDSFVLSGNTNAEDLPDQLRVLATKFAYPRWDETMFIRTRTNWLESYDLAFASASARANRESGAMSHPGDARWRPMEKEALARTNAQDARAFFDPLLRTGPIEAIIVGDVDLEKAVSAAAATIGALPPRPAPPAVNGVTPPRPNPKPVTFTHTGEPIQAMASIGWTTAGGAAPIRDRRALSLAAAILRTRMFDRLREEEGSTYSPSVSTGFSEVFPNWGIFVLEAQVRPERVDSFLRIAREQVADLASKPATAEEFARALNPAISGIERSQKTNGYWVGRLADWTSRPDLIEQTRAHVSDYKALTPEAVRAAMAAYVADEGDWSMVVLPEKKANGD